MGPPPIPSSSPPPRPNSRAPRVHSNSAASVGTTNSAVLGALGVLDRSSSRHKLNNKNGGGVAGAGGGAAGIGSGAAAGSGAGGGDRELSHSGGGGASTPGERGGSSGGIGGSGGKARRSSRQVLDRPRSSSWASFDDYGGYSSGERSSGTGGGAALARSKKKGKKQAKERERKAQVVDTFHQHYGGSNAAAMANGTGAHRPPSAPLPRGAAGADLGPLSHAHTGHRPPSAPPARQQYHHQQQFQHHQQQFQQQAMYQQQGGGGPPLAFDPRDDAAGRPTPPPPPLPPTQGQGQGQLGMGYQVQSQGAQLQPSHGYPQLGQHFHPSLQQQQQLPQGYAMPPYGYYPHMAPFYPSQTPSPPPAPVPSQNSSPNPSAYSPGSGSPRNNRRRSAEEGRRRSEESRRSLEYSEARSSSSSDEEAGEDSAPSRRSRTSGRTKQTSSSSNTKRNGRRHSSATSSNTNHLPQGHPTQIQQQQSGFPPQGFPMPFMGLPQQGLHGEHMVMPGVHFDPQQQQQQQQILAQHYLQFQPRKASPAISQGSDTAHAQQQAYGYQSYTPTPPLPLRGEEKEEEKPIGEAGAARYEQEDYFASNENIPAPQAAGGKKRISSVSFSTIEIRNYERVLGDNPSCSHGPAVSIGWQYEPDPITVQLDEYEYYRTEDRLDGTALVLSRSEREEILEERGYSRSAIADAVRTNVKIKNNRRQTVHNLPVARFEEVAESVRRKVKRVVLRKGKKDEQTSVRYSRAPVVLHSDDSEVRRRSSLRGSKNAAEATGPGALAPSQSDVPTHVVAVPPPRDNSPAPVSYTSSHSNSLVERKKKPVVVSEDNSLELGEDEAPSAERSSTPGLSIGTGSMAYDPMYGQFQN